MELYVLEQRVLESGISPLNIPPHKSIYLTKLYDIFFVSLILIKKYSTICCTFFQSVVPYVVY
jgi:hypothetical protein